MNDGLKLSNGALALALSPRRRLWVRGALRVGIVCLSMFVLMCAVDLLTDSGAAWAGTILERFDGEVAPLFDMLRGMIRLARIVMMFVAALLGIICGVMWYTGQQQAQGMLQKFFVAVFFIFGATAILDAILGVTMGTVEIEKAELEKGAVDNW